MIDETASEPVKRRLREAMGLPPDGDGALPTVPLRFVGPGRTRALAGRGRITLEDGAVRSVEGALPDDLPIGYHRLEMDGGGEPIRLFVTPRACVLPARRLSGLAAQLYAARSRRSWGSAILGDLSRLFEVMGRTLGMDTVLANPLCAVPPIHPQESSPYSPSSRRYLNPLYLSITDVPGAREVLDLEALSAKGRALSEARMIDRDAVYSLKMSALEEVWRTRPRAVEPDASLVRFAVYSTLAEQLGPDWRRWPEGLRRMDTGAVDRVRAEQPGRVDFFAWLQVELDRQLGAAARAGTLILDLPIGFRSDGADAWEWQDLLASGASIGAPPDAFNEEGQDWGLPPFVPHQLRAAFYQPFIQTLRAAFAHAGGLRIDHVMGLFRLYWVPHGADARSGAYVRFQADEMLDILAIESHRAGAFVIGEDLGTVEPGVREVLHDRNVLSCRLLWFEPEAPERWPVRALASITTHDLPTIAGIWTGADPVPELRDRLRDWGGIPDDAPVERAVEAAADLLKRSPSLVVMMQLEDAFLVSERPNVPGTIDRPNWCLALPEPIEALGDGNPLQSG